MSSSGSGVEAGGGLAPLTGNAKIAKIAIIAKTLKVGVFPREYAIPTILALTGKLGTKE
jgi:hypothetical protein